MVEWIESPTHGRGSYVHGPSLSLTAVIANREPPYSVAEARALCDLFLGMPSFTDVVAGFMRQSRRAARMCIATVLHRCQRVKSFPTAPPERRSCRKSRTLYIALTLHAPRSLSGPGPARVVPAPSFSPSDPRTPPLQSLAKDSAALSMPLHRHTLGPDTRLEHGPIRRHAAVEA